MSNSKISALTSATTPLAGTETLPIVQSSTTKQVSVANLTVGRAIQFSSAIVNGTTQSGTANLFAVKDSSKYQYSSIDTTAQTTGVGGAINLGGNYRAAGDAQAFTRVVAEKVNAVDGDYSYNMTFYTTANGGANYGVKNFIMLSTGDNINTGNLIQGTSAKGINFTANTPASGMTSQLLNWYEEGTWTPAQGSGLTVVGTFSSTGKYTRIGREVRISGTVTGSTSVAVSLAGVITNNLPFTVGTAGHGEATNAAINAFAAIICTSTNVTSAGAISSTTTITFSATYFV